MGPRKYKKMLLIQRKAFSFCPWTPLTPTCVSRHSSPRPWVHLDADMSMTAHVTAAVRSCFAALRQIRSVHHSLSRDALVALIRALVVTKLDYCCSVMVGVSGTLLRRLQSVLNAAARLVFSASRSDHITPCTAPGTSLAEDHRAYPVPFMCPGLPLSAW